MKFEAGKLLVMANKKLNILIVDDEINIRRTLSYCLTAENQNVVCVSTSSDALYQVRQNAFDMAFIDIRLGQESGIDLIEPLIFESPWTKIVIITAHASIENAVEAIKKGATDYIEKPFTPAQIRLVTNKIGKIRELENQIAILNQNASNIDKPALLSSKNAKFQRIIETAKKAASSEAIIFIQGESGTGKSLLARAIHGWSSRASRPMGVVSCPSIPSELLESELFGHVKGSFTGAIKDSQGRISSCEGGTLFLDEIGDMSLYLQPKLLRFIQDKRYERIGDSTTRKADVRIITATNVDLNKRVAEGLFREDLFYRINVITITLPPLREHPEDIMTMASDFMFFFCRVNHKKILGFEPEVENMLINHNWSGNIRELKNAVERAVILGNGEYIGVKDLPENINPQDIRLNPSIGDPISLSQIEEMHIRRLLANSSSIQEAATILGIDQATLWRRRKIYGI